MRYSESQLRRPLLALVLAVLIPFVSGASAVVVPGHQIALPRDGGSHPEFDTEWWYITGWLEDERGVQRGFQVTFFRTRNEAAQSNPSQFAAKQLLFAHAAVSDRGQRKLLHDQRSAREGFGLAGASSLQTDVHIHDWMLRADGHGYRTHVESAEFGFNLTLQQTQPPLLQGDAGFSRKGPDPKSASYYYSLPHLQVAGSLRVGKTTLRVHGTAWFDHEWFHEYVSPAAIGWDWIGINLTDGGALMVFRIRDPQGSEYWSGATLREGNERRTFAPEEISWQPLRTWQSPRTGVRYPVEWTVQVGDLQIRLKPLFDDQENDARGSVGVLYWEGAVEVLDSNGSVIGRGYLELTGYDRRLTM